MNYLFPMDVAYYRSYGKHLFSLDSSYVVAIISVQWRNQSVTDAVLKTLNTCFRAIFFFFCNRRILGCSLRFLGNDVGTRRKIPQLSEEFLL